MDTSTKIFGVVLVLVLVLMFLPIPASDIVTTRTEGLFGKTAAGESYRVQYSVPLATAWDSGGVPMQLLKGRDCTSLTLKAAYEAAGFKSVVVTQINLDSAGGLNLPPLPEL